MNLWRVPIDEASGTILGQPQPVTTPSPYSGYVSVSGDDHRIAYAQAVSAENLFKIGFDPFREASAGEPTAITVGHYRSRDGRIHAFLLSNGVFTSIDVPGAISTGSAPGGAIGINPQGQVAGWYGAMDGSRCGFVWTRGYFENVMAPGATATNLFGINTSGWVVDSYRDTAGKEHGFLKKI